MSYIVDCVNITPEELASRIFYLAWEACEGPIGMGFLQDRPNATENEVFNNILIHGDYFPVERRTMFGDLYADYVFGRMMKLSIRINSNSIEILNNKFDSNYQGFYCKYSTPKELVAAALNSKGLDKDLPL